MAMRATYGSPAVGRTRRRPVPSGYDPADATDSAAPRAQEEGERQGSRRPPAERLEPRLLIVMGSRPVSSSSRPRSATRFSAAAAAARRATRPTAARGGRLHRPDGQVAAVRRPLGHDPRGNVEEMEHVAADERAALPGAGDLGRVHGAAASGAGRAQPRARRHLHPVRQGRSAGDDRRAEGLLRQPPEQRRCSRRCRASARRSRSASGRRRAPAKPDNGTAHLAKCTTFDEKAYAAFFNAYQFKGPERFPAARSLPARSRLRAADRARGWLYTRALARRGGETGHTRPT